MPTIAQGNNVCGFFGLQCAACNPSEGCVQGKCTPVIGFDAGFQSQIGGPCFDDTQCGSDGLSFCIPEFSGGMPTGFPGGYCSRTCENQMCPTNSTCIEAQTSNGATIFVCVATCNGTGACRMGYQCQSQGMQSYCFP